jgi:hypothetical protein
MGGITLIIYLVVGAGGLWRIAYVVARRRTERQYLDLCRRVHDKRPTADVLTHAEKVLRPPTFASVIMRRGVGDARFASDHEEAT